MSGRHVRYGDTNTFRQTLQRRLGEAVDEIMDYARAMTEGPAKRELRDEISKIAHAIRAVEGRILGPQVPAMVRT
jgi:hypothetical protein